MHRDVARRLVYRAETLEPEAKEALPVGNLPTEDDLAPEPVAVDETPDDTFDAEHEEDTASITETEDDDAETASSEQTQ